MTKTFLSYCNQINSSYSNNLTKPESTFNDISKNQIFLNDSYSILSNSINIVENDFNQVADFDENGLGQMNLSLNQEINCKNIKINNFKDNYNENERITYEHNFDLLSEYQYNPELYFEKDYYKPNEEKNKFKNNTEINQQKFEQNGNIISNTIITFKKVIANKNKKNDDNETQSIVFKTKNSNYAKNGNNINKNSERISNIKKKIIRNFLQNNVRFWISDGKGKQLKKIKIKKKLIEYKGKKLKEIYSENNDYNTKIIKEANENMLIKLDLTFEEVFKAFCFKDIRCNFFFKKPFDVDFFSKLKSKREYINEKVRRKNDLALIKKSIDLILCDFKIIK